MAELQHKESAERAHCPGCGAALELAELERIVLCRYCGTESRIVRRLRVLEPDLPDGPPPKPPIDPSKDYNSWGTEALVWGILNGSELAEQIAMAKALDQWPHVNETMGRLLPHYVAFMLTAHPDLDKAMCGIVGKLICSDKLKLRNLAIRAGQRYGFAHPGSRGLLFALSLGDAGTVKLLLEIAEWASQHGYADYAKEALIGVRTAVGRERDYRHLCNQILIDRIPLVHGQVADWLINHVRLEFDVGYRQHREQVLELLDDMVSERPDLVEPLAKALRPCRNAEDLEQWRTRVRQVTRLRTPEARKAALETMGQPPNDMTPEATQLAVSELAPLLRHEALADVAAEVFAKLLWVGAGVPAPMQAFVDAAGDTLHKRIRAAYDLRTRR
ncbi:MAG: hypothetical protein KF696_16250 [Planctomycetes bacterium]|nr:hypothetical protein [Planctomycetota bacterium]MCW8137230.1 hypothetical protein [Planctomycetota bacterium]